MKYLLIVSLLFISQGIVASEKLKVVTSIPDIAEVVSQIGRSHVSVESLLEGTEDAHYVDALPSFVKKASQADVVCIVGLDLEIGWMPKVLSKSGNSRIQPGGNGYCDLGSRVEALEKPSGSVDRSMGDVHPAGNPHYNLSPKALSQAAEEVKRVLSLLRPQLSQEFETNLASFQNQMAILQTNISNKLKAAQERSKKGPILIEYHKELSYFLNVYGLKSYGSIEEKPGVPPSAARLAEVSIGAKNSDVLLALGATYQPEKHLKKFSELSGISYVRVPMMVQTKSEINTIEKLQNAIADQIVKALR